MIRFKNVLDENYNWQLNELFLSNEFPWYFQRKAHTQSDPLSILNTGFTHLFISNKEDNSDMSFILNPLMQFLNSQFDGVEILRAQANLLLNHNRPYIGTIHTDGFDEYETEQKTWFSAIYYVSNSDGDTVFFDSNGFEEERQEPVANEMLVFHGFRPHAASLPYFSPSRMVVNINGIFDSKHLHDLEGNDFTGK